MTNVWPPTVTDVRADAGLTGAALDADDETALTTRTAAAIAFVQRVRPDFNYTYDPTSCLDDPSDDVWQGTVMLARRLFDRRRSPDGLIDMGDLGLGRVPSVDPDIERMLGIGRFIPGDFA